MMSTLSVGRGDSEGEDPTSCAEAKKMKSLALHIHGCTRASLRDCSSFLFLLPLILDLFLCICKFLLQGRIRLEGANPKNPGKCAHVLRNLFLQSY